MSHEGHENRFFAFWLVAYGVVLGIAYSEDFLSLYFFYEALTLTTLPLVMHAMDERPAMPAANTWYIPSPVPPLPSSAWSFCSTTGWVI